MAPAAVSLFALIDWAVAIVSFGSTSFVLAALAVFPVIPKNSIIIPIAKTPFIIRLKAILDFILIPP